VAVQCEYFEPLRFEDEVEARLKVRELKSRSLSYDFEFRRVRPRPALRVASGSMTAVCVSRDPETGKFRAVSIPRAVASRIEAGFVGRKKRGE
jgi:acyl-CoA thioester hydrolase